MVDTTPEKLTADTLHDLPDDGKRYELIEGELVTMSPAGYEHGNIAALIIHFLVGYALKAGTGQVQSSETGYRTRGDEKTVRAPDASFMPYTTIPRDKTIAGYADVAPDLVVEVISPHDRTGDVDDKTREWLNFGVKLVWNVYPTRQQVHVYTQGDTQPRILFSGDTLDGGVVLPGFSLDVAQIFAD